MFVHIRLILTTTNVVDAICLRHLH